MSPLALATHPAATKHRMEHRKAAKIQGRAIVPSLFHNHFTTRRPLFMFQFLLEGYHYGPQTRVRAHRYWHRGHRDRDPCLRDRQLEFQQRRVGHRERGDVGASGQNQRVVGQVPQNWRPGTGTIITGAAANKAEAAALAKYPGGTVNRVLKLSDGSYAVHMIKISWPHHVYVSKNFKVTGAIG
jgi:hypothetical protein